MKATVTSQHPIYKDVFTTLLNGKRYDINITTGKVCHMVQVRHSYQNKDVSTKRIVNAVNLAAKEYQQNLN